MNGDRLAIEEGAVCEHSKLESMCNGCRPGRSVRELEPFDSPLEPLQSTSTC